MPPRLPAALLAAAAVIAVACTALRPAVEQAPLVAGIHATEARSPAGMVSTSSADATRAAVEVLESGGNAIDAAVAAAFVLGAGDAATSGLGGMTYVLIRLADGRVTAIDGSALVPLRLDRQRLAHLQEQLRKGDEEETSGFEFVAVPGTLACLDYAARTYGSRTLAALLAPAIAAAESGYTLTEAKRPQIERYLPVIRRSRDLRYFILAGGETLPAAGARFCNQELARTLRTIAAYGAEAFYGGAIATAIEADMIASGGFIRRNDLRLYKVREVEPLRSSYRGASIIAFPPPGGGGTVIEALNILEQFPAGLLAADSTERTRVLAEAFHIAFEDTRAFRDDSDTSRGGGTSHLSKEFAASRADLVRLGRPLTRHDLPRVPGDRDLVGGTTHVAVVDRLGNAVALSQTIGRFYGSKALTRSLGFPYNSLLEGSDFAGADEINPRARIATQMAPAIVEVGGKFVLTLGGSGSSKVPSAVALMISNKIDRGLTLGPAVESPRVLWSTRRGLPAQLYIEVTSPIGRSIVAALAGLGYTNLHVVEYPAVQRFVITIGAVNGIELDPATGDWVGVADPRRGGLALGPRI